MDKYTIKTAFKKSFSGFVWNIEADTAAGILAVETRDPETGIPAFSVIEYATGSSLVHEKQYGDRNWSLAGTLNNLLILRAWGQNTPEGAGIACLDATTGNLRWEQFNYTLVAIQSQQLVVRHRNFAGGYEQYLNLLNGDLTEKNKTPTQAEGAEITLPKRHIGNIPPFLQDFSITGDLFFHPVDNRVAWAFHETAGSTYRVHLVISLESTLLAQQVVVSGLPKMVPELFFLIDHELFLIGDNKREIVAYLV